MFDRLLAFGSTFDWITPVTAIAGDIINGPSYTLTIPEVCGWSGNDIVRLLHGKGIKTWGHMIVKGEIMITVKQSQARWALHVLGQSGIAAT